MNGYANIEDVLIKDVLNIYVLHILLMDAEEATISSKTLNRRGVEQRASAS